MIDLNHISELSEAELIQVLEACNREMMKYRGKPEGTSKPFGWEEQVLNASNANVPEYSKLNERNANPQMTSKEIHIHIHK